MFVLHQFSGGEVREFRMNLVGVKSYQQISRYLYGLCSYFIITFVIPLLFPLIISQVVSSSSSPAASHVQARNLESFKDNLHCRVNEMNLYNGLTQPSIKVLNSKFSPLEWTALSWGIGIVLVSPILFYLSPYLDHGRRPLLVVLLQLHSLLSHITCSITLRNSQAYGLSRFLAVFCGSSELSMHYPQTGLHLKQHPQAPLQGLVICCPYSSIPML
ncbi:uncharacterized protein LOC113322451 [Papaver somniferum]|uniref:uncharacterized protein LOC113322451 n=1 Tax=Papaver somniferum TaxID=3469 RepID=UPI000E703A1F|nr:uncharacterized protein LOC113322451 [Papaver somniferum]